MSVFFDFGFLTWSPKHSTFVRGWLVVVIDCKYPIYYKFNKIFIFAMAVTMIRTLKQESPRFWRGLMLVGLPTFASRTAALLVYPRQWQS